MDPFARMHKSVALSVELLAGRAEVSLFQRQRGVPSAGEHPRNQPAFLRAALAPDRLLSPSSNPWGEQMRSQSLLITSAIAIGLAMPATAQQSRARIAMRAFSSTRIRPQKSFISMHYR